MKKTKKKAKVRSYDIRGGERGKYAARYAKGVKVVIPLVERIRHRSVWQKAGGKQQIVCVSDNTIQSRWVKRNQNLGSGELKSYISAETLGLVFFRQLPLEENLMSMSCKTKTFLRHWKPTDGIYKGKM